MTQETYTEAELARKLGVSGQWIRSRRRSGVIPHTAVGLDGRYIKREIDRLVEAGAFSTPNLEKEREKITPVKPLVVNAVDPMPSAPSRPIVRKTESRPDIVYVDDPVPAQPIGRNEFVRNFWLRDELGVDVLTMPPELGADIIRYVTRALDYGYDYAGFVKTASPPVRIDPSPEAAENFQ